MRAGYSIYKPILFVLAEYIERNGNGTPVGAWAPNEELSLLASGLSGYLLRLPPPFTEMVTCEELLAEPDSFLFQMPMELDQVGSPQCRILLQLAT